MVHYMKFQYYALVDETGVVQACWNSLLLNKVLVFAVKYFSIDFRHQFAKPTEEEDTSYLNRHLVLCMDILEDYTSKILKNNIEIY